MRIKKMNIILKFTFHSCVICVPNGYINDLDKFQEDFDKWVYNLPECQIKMENGGIACSFDEDEVIKYINENILENCIHKAKVIEDNSKNRKKAHVLYF